MDDARDPTRDPLLRDVPTREGYKVLGRVALYSTLGRGGFAVVYRGRHLKLNLDVATKCLKPDLARENEQFIQRFEREAQQAARLNHPNVVRVFDVDEADGVHYLVMEFVDGEDARTRVKRKGPLPVEEAVQIVLGATYGLAEAHRAGLVHRDVKPDNILISGDGDVKLADLGLAKPADEEGGLTLSGQVMGTPQYMPPEQLKSLRDVEPSADVYSMGATLYYLLVGQEGIAGGSLYEVLERVKNDPFPDVREVRSEVPENIANVIARCTSKDARERPQDGRELAELLEGCTKRGAAILEDPETGSLTPERTLVSPPPAKTLDRIRVSLAATDDEPREQLGEQGGSALRWAAVVGIVAMAIAGTWWRFGSLGEESVASSRRDDPPEADDEFGVSNAAGSTAIPALPDDRHDTGEASVDSAEIEVTPRGGADAEPDERGSLLAGHVEADAVVLSAPPVTAESGIAGSQPALVNEEYAEDGAAQAEPAPGPVSIELDIDLDDEGRLHTRDQAVVLRGRVENPRTGRIQLERTSGSQEEDLGEGGEFAIAVLLQPNSSESLALRADGLVEPVVLTLVHDDEPPSIIGGSFPRRYGAESIRVEVELSEKNPLGVAVNQAGLERSAANKWVADGVLLPKEGENLLVFQAWDLADNRGTFSTVVVRDTKGPEILTVSPEPGSAFKPGELVEVQLDCNEPLGRLELLDARYEGDSIHHASATFATNAPLSAGVWEFRLALLDTLGNRAESSIRYSVLEPLKIPTGWAVLDTTPIDGWARRVEDPITGVVFLRVPVGSFLIGSLDGERDEQPQHRVEIDEGFYLAETELTQGQWNRVGSQRAEGWGFLGEANPAETVSWDECVQFCKDASATAPGQYRLPSEAEWEYACRGGKEALPFSTGDQISVAQANISRKGRRFDVASQTVVVGRYSPNEWGFYDMHGNVWEWCQDIYDSDAYLRGGAASQAPMESGGGGERARRGGSYEDPACYARSAFRFGVMPGYRYGNLGMRPAFTPD